MTENNFVENVKSGNDEDRFIRAKDILQLINSIKSDPMRDKEITVLPLMCGTGKSTAISYLIQQTIQNADHKNNGLLIVSDRVDRLYDYMQPYIDDLHHFLELNKDKVCIMTHENIKEAYEEQYYKPILMMTTQRYFRLTVSEINKLLKWQDGTRPLIVIDEYPELVTLVELDIKKLLECRAAIMATDNKIHMMDPYPEVNATLEFFRKLLSKIQTGKCAELNMVHCFWSWYTQINYRSNAYHEIFDYCKTNYKQFSKKQLNSYNGSIYYDDISTRLRAISEFKDKGSKALISQRKLDEGFYDASMLMLLDNYELVKDIDAKVFILDGTADLSPQYLTNHCCFENQQDFKRSLKNLHISLVNYPTGKTMLKSSSQKQKQLLFFVEKYLSIIINQRENLSKNQLAIFTYKDFEKKFQHHFEDYTIDHFGNIKGKNTFRNANTILQVGLNRYPDEVYYLLYRMKYPEKVTEHKNIEEYFNVVDDPTDFVSPSQLKEKDYSYNGSTIPKKEELDQDKVIAQSTAIDTEIKALKGETRTIMNQLLLAEIEQNLFRGVIRNSDSTEEFYYHLFFNTKYYADLVKLMKERYEPLGAEIVFIQLPEINPLLRIMTRKGDSYAKKLIEWHDKKLEIGAEYTPASIRQNIGMDIDAVSSYQLLLHKTPVLKGLLNEERIKHGVYKKKYNWYKSHI